MTDSLQPADPSVLRSVQSALGPGYVVERELGGGGMSRVFVATETALSRRIAIKVLSPELFQGVSEERFAREVTLAAQLQDPHIVPVMTTGTTADGLPWYTMPFIEGESLRARMQRGAIPLDEGIRILRDVAEALEYAHGRGIVHRDIKPENVLLSGRSAVVTDFGIAKAMSAARGVANGGTLTSVGLSLGTPAYMAPEQVAADGVDHRSDLYAWGIMAYELIAGAHPFASRTQAAQLMAAHLSEMPRPLSEVREGLPPMLAALVMQCLAKSPGERPADAAALLSALSGVTTDPNMMSASRAAVIAPAASAPKSRAVLVAAVALIAVLAGGAWAAKRGGMFSAMGGGESSTPSVVVLPFEHQGDSADAYLTEGITDEIRSKLAGVRDLIVIARTSSNSYRNSTKTPREIAQELGVRWLLTGTVRVTGSGEERRVIVRPELVEVTDAGQPQSRWGQPFDVRGVDVLSLQGDVATQVVTAMEVPALAGTDRTLLTAVATRDPQAYDLFLRARAATGFGANTSPTTLVTAEALFEQAIARDSTFTDAWLLLTATRNNLYLYRPTAERAANARAAAERTLALDPTGARGARAMGGYLRVVARDSKGALAATERAIRADSNDAILSTSLASSMLDLGRNEEGLRLIDKAARLDPMNLAILRTYISLLQLSGKMSDARVALARYKKIAPSSISSYEREWSLEVQAGDTIAARRVVAEAVRAVPQDEVLRSLTESGYVWLADPSLVRAFLARLPGDEADADTARTQLWKADWAWLTGDAAGRRAWGDSARREYAKRAQEIGTNWYVRVEYAQALSHAGRGNEAVREVRETLEMILKQGSDRRGLTYAIALSAAADVAVAAGDYETALTWLEQHATGTIGVSPAWLRVNPYFSALRGNPRFERLTRDVAQ